MRQSLLIVALAASTMVGATSVYEYPTLREGSPLVPAQQKVEPAQITMGCTSLVAEENLTWNFEAKIFEGHFEFAQTNDNPIAYRGPAAKQIEAWLKEGTAAGNAGDLYFNRDSNHSCLTVTNFPLLTAIKLDEKARLLRLDQLTPNMILPGVVFGNASLAITKGPFWRSAGRLHLTDQTSAGKIQLCYLNNQFWVFPAVDDFSTVATNRFDRFPGAAPYQLLTEGRSFSDQRFLRAALAASAAMNPDTKQAIVQNKLMGPTLQWLFRRSIPGVETETDYLTVKAHPTVFGKKDLDETKLVMRAHNLKVAEIPPMVGLELVNSRNFPITLPQPGRDYPDLNGEVQTFTPFAIPIVLRGPMAQRVFIVQAKAVSGKAEPVSFAWAIVHGDPVAVKIACPTGAGLNALAQGQAQITVDYRKLTASNRVDVACFAKTANSTWGAPSFVSFSVVPLEKREWRSDGRVASIDYTNPDRNYCDPAIALPRKWKDVYQYEGDNCTGFIRYSPQGEKLDEFNAHGERLAERNLFGKPKRWTKVSYRVRETGNPNAPQELVYEDERQ